MFLYKANETMEMLGHQRPLGILCGGGVAEKDFKNVLQAHKEKGTYSFFEFGIDAFMLGYIHGIRKERRERKKTIPNA